MHNGSECDIIVPETKKGTMSRKLLSEADIAALKTHPDVENVTERVVAFTAEFKRKVHTRMTAGEDIFDIFVS